MEFIAQALQLRHAARPRLLAPETRLAFARLAAAGVIGAHDATELIRADQAWRAVQGLLRISIGRAVPQILPETIAPRLIRALDRLQPASPGTTLLRRLDRMADSVSAAFARHIG